MGEHIIVVGRPRGIPDASPADLLEEKSPAGEQLKVSGSALEGWAGGLELCRWEGRGGAGQVPPHPMRGEFLSWPR